MNNRYLFRGKRTDDYKKGEWEHGYFCMSRHWEGGEWNDPTIQDVDGYRRAIDPTTVGQCTGLTAAKSYRGDSEHERLLFEGDVFHLGDVNIKYVVVWHDTGLKGKQIRSSSYIGLEHWQERIVITGTIHDDDRPELLSGEKGKAE